jgi:peptidoglycan/LPS O-acetylase OafA/YrhL
LNLGFLGVDLFFTLSGFILVYSYYGLPRTISGFYWARLIRIYPTYALALAVSVGLSALMEGPAGSSTVPVGVQLFTETSLLHAWVPGAACGFNCADWSLSVEMFFYACFPFIVACLERFSLRVAIGLASALWLVTLVPAVYVAHLERLYGGNNITGLFEFFVFHPLTHIGKFTLGAVAGVWFLRSRSLTPGGSRLLGWVLTLAAVAVLTLVELAPPASEALLRAGLLSPLFVMLIVFLASSRGWVAALLGSAPLVLLGESSYAVYLYQTPVNRGVSLLARQIVPQISPMLVGAVAFTTLISVSVASFLYFERPVRLWLRRQFYAYREGVVST